MVKKRQRVHTLSISESAAVLRLAEEAVYAAGSAGCRISEVSMHVNAHLPGVDDNAIRNRLQELAKVGSIKIHKLAARLGLYLPTGNRYMTVEPPPPKAKAAEPLPADIQHDAIVDVSPDTTPIADLKIIVNKTTGAIHLVRKGLSITVEITE